MDLRQIRSFVHVADLKSFTRASAFLHVSQPALSRQMRLFEEELGTKLFHRHGHGVSLTGSGAVLFEQFRKLLNDLEKIREDVGSTPSKSSVTGSVGLGMPMPLTPLFADPFLHDLKAIAPNISLRIVEGFSVLLHEWVVSGSIDFAILYGPNKSKVLASERLVVEDLYAVAAATPEHLARASISASELGQFDLILPHRPHVIRDMVDAAGVIPPSVIEVDANTLMIELARIGKGVTILPYPAVKSAVMAGQLAAMPIRSPTFSWDVSICYSNLRQLNEAGRVVLSLVRDEVVRLVRDGRWIARAAN